MPKGKILRALLKMKHSPAGMLHTGSPSSRKEQGEILASRRRLNKARKQFEEVDNKINERLKNIDKLHKKNKILRAFINKGK